MIVAKRVKAGKLFGDLVIDQRKHPFELDLEEGRCTVKKSDFDNLSEKTWYNIKVNTKITKKGKIIFTNLGKKYYTELSKFSILLNISFSL